MEREGSRAVTALLVIDAQIGLLEGTTAVPAASALLDRLATLLDSARSAGALVIHLQHDGEPGSVDEPRTPRWPIHPIATPRAHEVVLRKSVDDGFEGTDLDGFLRRSMVERLAIAGLLSEMCVSATARTAMARGFEVVLVADAHATYDLEEIPHGVVSRVAEHALGDLVRLSPAATIAFAASGPGSPQP